MRIERVPYSELGLFAGVLPAYVSDYAGLADCYAADPADADGLKRRADAARAGRHPRAAVALALEKYNRGLGADEAALANAARLRSADCAAVVTGQQPGLLGGPLYTWHKALTAIRLARHFEQDLGVPCVPVFWNASDGHAAAEYAAVTLAAKDGAPARRTIRDIPEGAPAFDAQVSRDCTDAVGEYCASLPETEFTAEIADMLTSACRGNLAESFSRLMLRLLSRHGLVLMEPRILRREAAPIIAREIETRGESSASVREAKRRLEAAGYSAPFDGDEGVKVFMHDGGLRRRLETAGDGFRTRGGATFSSRELLDALEKEPGRFSPDAALRPIVQDALLPTAAYVAGPTETAYFAQLKKVYEFFDVPMPVIYPRASATLVEKGIAHFLENFGLAAKDFLNGARPPGDAANPEKDDGLEREFSGMMAEIEKRLAELRATALEYEPTLEKPFEKTEARIRSDLMKLRDRAAAARLNRLGIGRRQWSRLKNALLPEGKLQERVYPLWPWVCRHGPGLLDELLEYLPFREFCHTLVCFE